MKKDTNIILKGVGGAALIITGIISFFTRAAAVSAISKGLAVVALVVGVILLVKMILGMKNEGKFSIDFLIWFALAFLLSNTSILSSVGGIVVIVIGAMMVIHGVTTLKISLADSSKATGSLIIAVLFILAGGFIVLNHRMIFDEAVGKLLGIYLFIQGISMVRDTIGMAKYERNFKGVE